MQVLNDLMFDLLYRQFKKIAFTLSVYSMSNLEYSQCRNFLDLIDTNLVMLFANYFDSKLLI